MNGGVEGFHPAIKRFGKAGDLAHIGDRNPCFAQLLRGGTRRDNLYSISHQSPPKIKKAGLIAHRHQRAGGHDAMCGSHGVLREWG